MDDDEDLLHRILHSGSTHPEPAERLPDEVDVRVIDFFERG
jgi:hypothetical protein